MELRSSGLSQDFTAFSVRDGRLTAVTCVTCGCRLERHADGAWWHFAGRDNRDARGCTVACVTQPHYLPGAMAATLR